MGTSVGSTVWGSAGMGTAWWSAVCTSTGLYMVVGMTKGLQPAE